MRRIKSFVKAGKIFGIIGAISLNTLFFVGVESFNNQEIVEASSLYSNSYSNFFKNWWNKWFSNNSSGSTAKPTVTPTIEPTIEPTVEPTAEPTIEPTVEPTAEPTIEPTVEPTAEPTIEPTVEPTAEPTIEPTVEPTAEPTIEPTIEPTVEAYSFENIEDMLSADLVIGTTCETRGYYTDGDNGNATYIITSEPDILTSTDDFLVHELDNGLYANMVIENEEVNVMAAGIQTDTRVASLINKAIKSCVDSNVVKKLVFNDGRYLIEVPVELRSLEYIGEDDTEFYVVEDFKTTSDMIFRTANYYSGLTTTLAIENIDFIVEINSNFSMLDKETIVVALMGIDACRLEGCTFTAKQASIDGCFAAVDLVIFKEGNTNNVTIKDCKFNNLTCEEDGEYVVGGCLWLWGGWQKYDNMISNVNIENCEFVHTTNDEALCIWGCKGENVNINDCTFTIKNHQSDNLMSIYDMEYKDFEINRCAFNIEAPAMNIIKCHDNREADLDINNCTFDIKNDVTSIWTKNRAIVYLQNVKEDDETKDECLARTNYYINNCNVIGNNTTAFRTFVTLINSNATIDSCNIDAGITYLAWIENAFGDINVKNSYINMTRYADMFILKNVTDMCNIILDGNTIQQHVALGLYGNFAFNYTMTNNNIIASQFDYVLESYGTPINEYTNSIVAKNNKVTNENNLKYSNVSLDSLNLVYTIE